MTIYLVLWNNKSTVKAFWSKQERSDWSVVNLIGVPHYYKEIKIDLPAEIPI